MAALQATLAIAGLRKRRAVAHLTGAVMSPWQYFGNVGMDAHHTPLCRIRLVENGMGVSSDVEGVGNGLGHGRLPRPQGIRPVSAKSWVCQPTTSDIVD